MQPNSQTVALVTTVRGMREREAKEGVSTATEKSTLDLGSQTEGMDLGN